MGKRILAHIDWAVVFFTLVLALIGLVNLYSATFGLPVARYFNSQLIWVTFGIFLMAAVMLIDYQFLDRISLVLYVIVLLLLVAVLVSGKTAGGSTRWLFIGGFHLQPSELMKSVIILALAKHFKDRKDRPPYGLRQLIIPGIILGLPMILILKQPDLGTTLTLGITGLSMIVFVGLKRTTIAGMAVAAAVSLPLAWSFILSDYQKNRVITFLQPEKYHLAGGYQVIQSKIAVGSGMLTGKGFLGGTQSKLMFLPKQYTDFVFSNFAEEWGFLGCAVLVFCFYMFVLSGLNVAQHAKDRLGSLIAVGVTAFFFWHFAINIGMELGLLPVVGLPLPFLSYGGSVTVTSFLAVGLLLSVSIRKFVF